VIRPRSSYIHKYIEIAKTLRTTLTIHILHFVIVFLADLSDFASKHSLRKPSCNLQSRINKVPSVFGENEYDRVDSALVCYARDPDFSSPCKIKLFSYTHSPLGRKRQLREYSCQEHFSETKTSSFGIDVKL